jgi:3-oxoacyl-[acyl-carrier-protein] synthase III
MRYSDVFIESMGYFLPETILTSEAIEMRLAPLYDKLNLEKGWLEATTGIRERRMWPLGTAPSSVAAEAGRVALEAGNIAPGSVDLLIHTGVSRDALEPATASMVHQILQLNPMCMVFDLSNACLGMLNAMSVAAAMIECGAIRTALLVSGENAAPLYETTLGELDVDHSEAAFTQALASLTLGSGAVAYVLQHSSLAKSGHRLLGSVVESDSSGAQLCLGDGTIREMRMRTDTRGLLRKGLALSASAWERFKSVMEWLPTSPMHVITHQVSRTHQRKVFEILGLDEKKGSTEIDWLGNTGSVAAPLSLALQAEKGLIAPGDLIAMLGIGSGINTQMMAIQW